MAAKHRLSNLNGDAYVAEIRQSSSSCMTGTPAWNKTHKNLKKQETMTNVAMKTLSSPPTVYIHHASLETLHTESVEWLNDLSFWREEMSFFYKLLRNKEIICLLPARELEMVDQEMIKLTSEGLAEMGKKVEQHEQNLKKAIHPVLLCEEQRYREMHKLLLSQMHHIYAQVKEFKKKILSFITKYEYLSDRINRKNKY